MDYDEKVIEVARTHSYLQNFVNYPQLEEFDTPKDKYVVYDGVHGYLGFTTSSAIAWTPRQEVAEHIVNTIKEKGAEKYNKAEVRKLDMVLLAMQGLVVSMNAGFPAFSIEVEDNQVQIIEDSYVVIGEL